MAPARVRFLRRQNADSWSAAVAVAVADHEEMVRAPKARDGQALSAALANQLTRTRGRIKDAV